MTASRELSQQYAQAIFGYALDKWVTTLTAVQSGLENNADLAQSINDARRKFETRKEELDSLIPEGTDQDVRNFLYTLIKDDNVDTLGLILEDLDRMLGGKPKVQVGHVTTAVELSEEEKAAFSQKLRQQFGDALELQFHIDSSLIGGAVVQIGDKVIDGSVASRMDSLSNALGVQS